MSKAFTKDEGAADFPVVVPPRAPLPPGAPNLVTARGLALLRDELQQLEVERRQIAEHGDETERARRLGIHTQRLGALKERIHGAQLVDTSQQPHDEIRFGATVVVRTITGANVGRERRFTIVGVDEAAPAEGRIAFTAPLARALLGLHVGEVAQLQLVGANEELEVTAIDYGFAQEC